MSGSVLDRYNVYACLQHLSNTRILERVELHLIRQSAILTYLHPVLLEHAMVAWLSSAHIVGVNEIPIWLYAWHGKERNQHGDTCVTQRCVSVLMGLRLVCRNVDTLIDKVNIANLQTLDLAWSDERGEHKVHH